jgi:hypothetical protein
VYRWNDPTAADAFPSPEGGFYLADNGRGRSFRHARSVTIGFAVP